MGEFILSFADHPGRLYVIVTLLPLLSFTILLVGNGLRSWLQRHYDYNKPRMTLGAKLYKRLGGIVQDRRGAWIGTITMFVAFCITVFGFIQYSVEHQHGHGHGAHAAHGHDHGDHTHGEEKEHYHHELKRDSRWSESFTWFSLSFASASHEQHKHHHKEGEHHKEDEKEEKHEHHGPLADASHATSLKIGYKIDYLSGVMFMMVTFIATLIHLFSMGYMSDELKDPVEDHEVHTEFGGHLERRSRFTRFFTFLSLFCFSMLNLILADNLFQIFVSWELVGICSFLLIGFYYERQSAANAANKAFITNRIGDAGFIIGILIIWTYVGTLNFDEIFFRLRSPQKNTDGHIIQSGDQIIRGTPVSRDEAKEVWVSGKAEKDIAKQKHEFFKKNMPETLEKLSAEWTKEHKGEPSFEERQKLAAKAKEKVGKEWREQEPENIRQARSRFAFEWKGLTHFEEDRAAWIKKKEEELFDHAKEKFIQKQTEKFHELKIPEEEAQKKAEEAWKHHAREAKLETQLQASREWAFAQGHYLKIQNKNAPITFDTQVVLFPRENEHVEPYDPAGTPLYDSRGDLSNRGDTLAFVYDHPKKDQNGTMPYWLLVLAGIGIFLGCVGKSAQFPLHVWLPDAMEGPTPVSALIHAATMVAAGVYLVGRAYPIFTMEVLLVIAYTGAITLFVAATIAVVMHDIKKVLAYSTVSQLGYMMLALGIGGWVAGLMHLVTHAFFKDLLFLGSGSVIYGCHHVQDMRKMGGLYPKMKITALTMLVGVFAIAGVPLFSGWYSKDAIVAQAFGYGVLSPHHFLLTLLPVVTAGITTFYMFRMWFLTFTGEPKDHHVFDHAHESPWYMTVPLVLLAIGSVVVATGYPPWQATASALEHTLHHSQPASVVADFGYVPGVDEPVPYNVNIETSARHQAHVLHDIGGVIALLMVFVGVAFAAAIYWYRLFDPAEVSERVTAMGAFLTHKWYFDELYSALLIRPSLIVAMWAAAFDRYVIDGFLHLVANITVWLSWFWGQFDRYVVDGLVNIVSDVCYRTGYWLRNVQTGSLRSYVLFLVLGAIGIWVILALFVRAALGSM